MAKKTSPKNSSLKNPKEGDVVFLIGAKKHLAMLLKNVVIEDGKKYGVCVWDKLTRRDNGEFDKEPQEATYPLTVLTLKSFTDPTSFFIH